MDFVALTELRFKLFHGYKERTFPQEVSFHLASVRPLEEVFA